MSPRAARRPVPSLCLLLAALALPGCAPEPSEPEPPAAARVESRELGIAVAALPPEFEVVSNDGRALVLAGPGDTRLEVTMGPEERSGVNLVDAVRKKKAEIEAAPGGSYLGNRELMTPIGTAFTARGVVERDGAPVEETTVYAVHPSANRLLTLTYRYPAGEAETRVQELLSVLGEVEGIGFPGG